MSLHSFLCIGLLIMFAGIALSVSAQAPCTGNAIFTSKACAGDEASPQEQALYDLVSKYRAAHGKPAVRLSPALSMVANRHLLDIEQNIKIFTHSWSNCAYDIAKPDTWPCLEDAPKRLNSGYDGKGYETLYRTAKGNASPSNALDKWKQSTLHNSIILNLGTFRDITWDEVGVAVKGPYAALWFGSAAKISGSTAVANEGVSPLSYEKAVTNLSGFVIATAGGRSQALSADGKVVLALSREKHLTDITLKLEPGGRFTAATRAAAASILKNLFAEWTDADRWLDAAAMAIAANGSASRTRVVRGISIEARGAGANVIRIQLKTRTKQGVIEM